MAYFLFLGFPFCDSLQRWGTHVPSSAPVGSIRRVLGRHLIIAGRRMAKFNSQTVVGKAVKTGKPRERHPDFPLFTHSLDK
jgi:hypothetical protein